jgi:hypothetical protein
MKRLCLISCTCATMLLLLAGCPPKVENLQPADGAVILAPEGTVEVTFEAEVTLQSADRKFIEFQANPDGWKEWWDSSRLQVGLNKLTWKQTVSVDAGSQKTFQVIGYECPWYPDPTVLAETTFTVVRP